MKHLVIIPTYNEKENVAAIIEAVMDLGGMDVLIVDDGSPDGTATIVRDIQSKNKYTQQIHLIEREGKLGLGTAYIRGFKFGLEHGYDIINEMDADFSHPPKDLLRLRQTIMDGADVAIGSRYIHGGGFVNWSRLRIFISKGGSAYVRLMTKMPIKDPTAGFVAYSSTFLRSFDLDQVEFTGYGFQIEMKYIAYRLGFKLVEIPIIFKDRELGTSKMNISIINEAINGVLKLIRRDIQSYYKAQTTQKVA
ncbi:MAG: polyprenol monophosphomannose synthase [Bacteroidota bacterium]